MWTKERGGFGVVVLDDDDDDDEEDDDDEADDGDLPCAGYCESKLFLCVPGSFDCSSISMYWKSEDPTARRDSPDRARSPEGRRATGVYGPPKGSIRRNGIDVRVRTKVPRASNKRKRPVSPLKKTEETDDQKKALRPRAARGNAVAVPR